MDSRGIYMSPNAQVAEPFARGLLASLAKIDERMKEWGATATVTDRAAFAAASATVAEFVRFRTELVRLGREVSTAEARKFGDNDDNRRNRQQLNTQVQELASRNEALIGQLTSDLEDFQTRILGMLAALWGIGIVAGTVVAYGWISRLISRPIRGMTTTMSELAEGRIDVEVPYTRRADEIGKMAATVQVFKENAQRVQQLHEEQESLKRRAEDEKRKGMATLAEGFNSDVMGVVDAVSTSSSHLKASATTLSSTAARASGQTDAAAKASESASRNVQTVAAAAEELSASIAEISRQVGQSAAIAAKAVKEANRTNATVTGLSEAAKRIGEVVKLINDIAGQTNLLALNATIEAARAGDAGKGFAVVASEVKSLANQTAKATEDIAQQINAIQTATAESVTAIKGIGETIGEIDAITATISDAIQQQGTATQEIARGVQQAAAGTAEVSTNIVGVTEGVGMTRNSAAEVLTAAEELSKQSQALRDRVNGFLSGLRAA
jgi:methyl-accepting chemotaxis protein